MFEKRWILEIELLKLDYTWGNCLYVIGLTLNSITFLYSYITINRVHQITSGSIGVIQSNKDQEVKQKTKTKKANKAQNKPRQSSRSVDRFKMIKINQKEQKIPTADHWSSWSLITYELNSKKCSRLWSYWDMETAAVLVLSPEAHHKRRFMHKEARPPGWTYLLLV